MNNELRIAISEDLPADRDLLLSLIHKSGIPASCDTFKSGEALLEKLKYGLYHLIYLDIYMDKLDGIQTAARIREVDQSVLLAFTTTSRDHAFEANKYLSILYIEKPVTQEMITHTLTLADSLKDKMKHEVLTVPTDKKLLNIRYQDLAYVEVSNQRCILHLHDGRELPVSTTMSIDKLEKLLPAPRFIRTHRSYVVNLDLVIRSNGIDFEMAGGGIAYITRKEYSRIMKAYDKYLFEQARGDRF